METETEKPPFEVHPVHMSEFGELLETSRATVTAGALIGSLQGYPQFGSFGYASDGKPSAGMPAMCNVFQVCLEEAAIIAAENYLKEEAQAAEDQAARLISQKTSLSGRTEVVAASTEMTGAAASTRGRQPSQDVVLINPFISAEEKENCREGMTLTPHPVLQWIYQSKSPLGLVPSTVEAKRWQESKPADADLMPTFRLDAAAAVACQALGISQTDTVLDLCAGAGNKSVLLATALFGDKARSGKLVCNEPDSRLAAHLKDVLAAFVPEALLSGGRIVVTKAAVAAKAPTILARHGPFSKILIDPPCTRALDTSDGGRASTTAATKQNAIQMEDMLRCAAEMLQPAGEIVYCTTSAQDLENDEVLRKFLRRAGNEFEVVRGREVLDEELTSYGYFLDPNRGASCGPLYYSCLRRKK